MAHDVFISYAVQDRPVAEAVCAALESKHIRCWIAPRDIWPGAEWAEAVVDAIDESRIFVLVFSSSSNASRQVVREVERAMSQGTTIIPLRIDDAPLSKAMQFYIDRYHWLDARTPPLKKHLQQLAQTIQNILGQERPVYQVVPAPEETEKPAISVGQPVLNIDRERLDFTDIKPGSRAVRSFSLNNAGTGSLTGTITTTQPWLKVSPDKVDLEKGQKKLSVTVDTIGLAPGFVGVGDIIIDTNGGQAKVTVGLSVVAVPEPQPILSVDCERLDFTDVKPGGLATKGFTLRNTGTGRLTGKIATTQPWLKVSPDIIDLDKGGKKVEVTVDTVDLAPSFHGSGDIIIDTNGGQAKVAVSLSIATVAKPKPIVKPAARMRLRRSLITILGAILFAIAGFSGIYFAFGHLFAPSPPPTMRGVSASDITETSAVITWTTDKPATSQAQYGYTADCGLTTSLDEELLTSHRVELTGLQPNTTCHFRVVSKDAGGNEAISDTDRLTTLPPDTAPPVLSEVKVARYTGESATIIWETDEDAIGQVEYGTTEAYGRSAASDGTPTTSHGIKLTGLQPNTTYHFRVQSRDGKGNDTGSGDHTFTTWVAEKDWAEYVNEEYGFSLKYPSVWIEFPMGVTGDVVASFVNPLFREDRPPIGVSITLADAEQAWTTDWTVAAMEEAGSTDIEVVSESEGALADGTPTHEGKAFYSISWRTRGPHVYPMAVYYLVVDKDGKRIAVTVWDGRPPYDEALLSQIAHTLRFTAKEEPAAEPEAEPPTPSPKLVYKDWAEYVNEEYGFSVKYPSVWVERPELVIHDVVASFGFGASVPGTSITVADAEEAWTADSMVAVFKEAGNTDTEILSESKGALADGTPTHEGKIFFRAPIADFEPTDAYYLVVDKDGKRIMVLVWTIETSSPYDEALFSQIAHTLRFTAEEEAAAEPEAEPPTPLPKLVYKDDFSDPASGWPTLSGKEVEAYYEDGEYHLLVNPLSSAEAVRPGVSYYRFGLASPPDAGPFTDFIVEADVRPVGGWNLGYFGLVFRAQDMGNFYKFLVSGDGSYCLEASLNGQRKTLQKPTESQFIEKGKSTNHLKVVCQGSQIELFVNEHHLTSLTRQYFTDGYVGVIVDPRVVSRTEFHGAFDNFRVSSPD